MFQVRWTFHWHHYTHLIVLLLYGFTVQRVRGRPNAAVQAVVSVCAFIAGNHWAVTQLYWVEDERPVEHHKNINTFWSCNYTKPFKSTRMNRNIHFTPCLIISPELPAQILKPVKVWNAHRAYNIHASIIKDGKDPAHPSFLGAQLILGSNNLSILMLKHSSFCERQSFSLSICSLSIIL